MSYRREAAIIGDLDRMGDDLRLADLVTYRAAIWLNSGSCLDIAHAFGQQAHDQRVETVYGGPHLAHVGAFGGGHNRLLSRLCHERALSP